MPIKVFFREDIEFLERCAALSGKNTEVLMYNAGKAVADFILETLLENKKDKKLICILLGKGNNGGDGYVAANILQGSGMKVSLIKLYGDPSATAAKNAMDNLTEGLTPISFDEEKAKCEELILKADVIVDAVFGFGFKGECDLKLHRVSELSKISSAVKVSVDIPSGCECDSARVSKGAFKADYTLTFTALKPALTEEPAASYSGEVHIASVGIDKNLVDSCPPAFTLIDDSLVKSFIPKRKRDSNKGDFGRLLMICGTYSMAGACIMAAKAALRSGVGLLDIAISSDIYPIVAAAVPEAIFTVMNFDTEESSVISSEKLFNSLNKASAVLIGCGLGQDAKKYLETVLRFSKCPIVLDADALNFTSENTDILALASYPLVLTPHPGEMGRLIGKTASAVQEDRYNIAKKFAMEHKVILCLKGSGTIVAMPDGEMHLNPTGNPGMAKGGSGDVLAGICASLLASGLKPEEAAIASVYVHGKAGDICAKELSQIAMLPTDIINKLPAVYKMLEN